MEAKPEHVPFLGLLDVAHHGTIAEVEHTYAAHAEIPLLVAHMLQQLHGAKAEYLEMVDEASR
jgi:hypothetical protein